MAYVAVDENGNEFLHDDKPIRARVKNNGYWIDNYLESVYIDLPKGSIEKLIGKKLTWEDEPVKLKEQK